MSYLIEGYWYQADAHKLGITFSTKALNAQVAKIKKASFKTAAAFQAYLKESGETLPDLQFQIRVNEIYTKLLTHYEKKVTTSAIDAYYAAHKASYASAASVTGHLIRSRPRPTPPPPSQRSTRAPPGPRWPNSTPRTPLLKPTAA